MPTTIEELIGYVVIAFFLSLLSLISTAVFGFYLDKYLSKEKKREEEKDLIDKTRMVVFDELCEYFEHRGMTYHNESKSKKEKKPKVKLGYK